MEKSEVLGILKEFGIGDYTEKNEIDSSLDEDYRLNIVIDKKYVLRINNDIITEERLASIDRLVERYREIGVLAPRLYKTMSGSYSIKHGDHICYVSEYLDYSSWRDLESEADDDVIYSEVMKSIGRLANKYTDVDLSPVNSMWSLIDLSPIDVDIDEKQDNLNTLIEGLKDIGEDKLAKEIESFNEETRARIGKVYKNLPRCVIQGDLNASNIMVDKGHFVGLIDFNMAGTEVNVNNFCCETNCGWFAEDFDSKDADRLYDDWVKEQNDWLEVILSEYTLNDLEKSVIDDYRRICRISMYPNVMNYLGFFEKDKEKTLRFLKRVIQG